jgi:hypothetical protein
MPTVVEEITATFWGLMFVSIGFALQGIGPLLVLLR